MGLQKHFIRISISAVSFGFIAASSKIKPHVCVVGAGWGGWGAAKALCENGCHVTLLDCVLDPTGETPYLSPTGKPFEPGTRGFWRDYPNINNLVAELGLVESDVFTEYTNSSFYSPDGLEATAPVFSSTFYSKLPSLLGQVLATSRLFERIPVKDRASVVGLLLAMIDYSRDETVFSAYDRITAQELFRRMGLSKRLVDDFIRPTLLVGLFKPPEELSAAVTMELLYYYALAHTDSFDVRWIKRKSISETIIAPLARKLREEYSLQVLGGARVESIALTSSSSSRESARVSAITYSRATASGSRETLTIPDVDACVLALGARGLRGLLAGSPELARMSPELSRAASLGSIDVMACRLWLDKKVPTRTPANVLSRFDELRGAGGTFFMLDQLQEDENELWGDKDSGRDTARGSVVACDFYNAGALLPLADSDVVSLLMDKLLPAAVRDFRGAKVVDAYVQRYPGAVSWFSPGSFALRPPLELPGLTNCVCAGDWVRMGDHEHGAKGLCQERAFVSGLEAANALARSGALNNNNNDNNGNNNGNNESGKRQKFDRQARVLPVRADEVQYALAKQMNSKAMRYLSKLGLDSMRWLR